MECDTGRNWIGEGGKTWRETVDIERVDRGKERGMNGGKKEEHGGVKWRVKMGKMGERQRGRPPKAISTLCSHEYFDDAQIHTYSYTHCKKILSPHLERSVKKTFAVCVCFKSFWFNQTAHLKRQDYLDLNRKGTSIADGNRGKNRHHKHNCFISAEASG